MRDINPDPYGPRERSIRNVPLSRHAQPMPHAGHPPRPRRPRRARRRILIISGAVAVLCIAAGALLSTVFAGAKVTVSPRTESVAAPTTLVAQLVPSANGLGYQTINVTRSATTTVPATGTKTVSRQASGVITIQNTYSSATQRLIANTRFEASDGKIYRIRDSVVVPGMSGSKAGSASATIYADSPGESYNRTAATTFTIPGFKGDPRYSKFIGRSEGAISGGFVGPEPAVADADLSKAKAELSTKLEQDITAAAAAAVPTGFVAVPGTLKVSYGATAQTPAAGNSAAVVQAVQATGAIVAVVDLASAIARAKVTDYKGEAVSLDPSSQLNVSATSTTNSQGTLTLSLSGSAILVWQFDPNAVKQALLGKPKGEFENVLKSFAPALRCSAQAPCEASIRPFWQSSFPSDPSKITVSVK